MFSGGVNEGKTIIIIIVIIIHHQHHELVYHPADVLFRGRFWDRLSSTGKIPGCRCLGYTEKTYDDDKSRHGKI